MATFQFLHFSSESEIVSLNHPFTLRIAFIYDNEGSTIEDVKVSLNLIGGSPYSLEGADKPVKVDYGAENNFALLAYEITITNRVNYNEHAEELVGIEATLRDSIPPPPPLIVTLILRNHE